MIPAGARLGVAVSAGADSVFLLHALRRFNPAVIHLNHGLRGTESEGDAAFTADLASRLGLELYTRAMGQPTGNLEDCCRQARREFFGQLIRSGVVDRIATGHTASDQAETVLMRLLRGAGSTGLRGILPVTSEGLVRPLLEYGRQEIRDWLSANNILWRDDSSNDNPSFLRNRIRSQVLPALRSSAPSVDTSLLRLAHLSLIDEDYWETETAAAFQRVSVNSRGAVILACRDLARLHPALQLRVVRKAIQVAAGSLLRIDFRHVDKLLELALSSEGSGRAEVPGALATRSLDWLRIEKSPAPAPPESQVLILPSEVRTRDYSISAWLEGSAAGEEASGNRNASIDWSAVQQPLRLRYWEPGDRFQPVGSKQVRLVKDLFQRARIPSWDRHSWPMIADAGGIIWMHEFGVAHLARAAVGTQVCLRVQSAVI